MKQYSIDVRELCQTARSKGDLKLNGAISPDVRFDLT